MFFLFKTVDCRINDIDRPLNSIVTNYGHYVHIRCEIGYQGPSTYVNCVQGEWEKKKLPTCAGSKTFLFVFLLTAEIFIISETYTANSQLPS